MTQDTLAVRISRYLERHIAFMEESLQILAEADFSAEQAALVFEQRAEMAAQLDSEQMALLNEWQGGRASTEDEQAAVRALAMRAGALAERLRAAYGDANTRVMATAATVLLQADSARRGADTARRFGLSGQDTGGFIDHSA